METQYISLNDIIHKKEAALNALKKSFEDQGWAFVTLTDDLVALTQTAAPVLQQYLAASNDKSLFHEDWWKYKFGALGFYNYPAKCGLRLLTGKELRAEKTVPPTLTDVTVPLVNAIEKYMVKIVQAIANPFFGLSSEDAAKKLDIPLILPKSDNSPHFGMVDIACYHNKIDQKNRPEMNCVAHYDPGLLSLSVIQTYEGLQLQDANGNWVDGPSPQNTNIGVIWTGDAAKKLNESFKTGIHQVIYPKVLGTPRLSIWGEVCTRDQALNTEHDQSTTFNTASKIIVPNIIGSKKEYIIAVQPGKLLEALQLVEQVKGLPWSKIMRRPIYNDQGEVTGVK